VGIPGDDAHRSCFRKEKKKEDGRCLAKWLIDSLQFPPTHLFALAGFVGRKNSPREIAADNPDG